MTEEQDMQLIKNKIEDFFNNLNDEYKTTVVSVTMQWIEHRTMEKDDKYYLYNCDVDIKL